MKVKMRYEYTVTKEGGEAEIMKAMSWKKLIKLLLLKYPKFSGWCTYINKKGHIQVKALSDGKLIHDYKSLYYDTEDWKFYLDHHNGRVNRNKIRFREYVGSKLTFLEIKLKNNKGKTIKKRNI